MLHHISALNPIPSQADTSKVWFRMMTELSIHRKNIYLTYEDLAKRSGLSASWLCNLFRPSMSTRHGRKAPTYQIDLMDKVVKALGLELVSFPQYDLVRIPAELERRRKATKISYADLAPLVDTTAPTIHRWLTCRTPMPVIPMMRLMIGFGMEPLVLLGEVHLTNSDPSRKPWGSGERAQAAIHNRVAYVELPNGNLKPVEQKFAGEISPDGVMKWLD